MTISVPPSRRYQNPLVSLPDPWNTTNPPEGPRLIPFEIIWSTMGGPNYSVDINFTGGGTGSPNDFSRCAALSVDNSECGATVRFVFQDTGDTVTIPAYSPKVIVPVFSNAKNFFVMVDGATVLPEDTTRFIVHNTMPPPIAVPTSNEQSVAAILGRNITIAEVIEILPAGTNGTLENGVLSFSSTINGTAFSTTGYTIADGDGRVLGVATWAMTGEEATGNAPENAIVWSVNGAHLRFTNGLFITVTLVYGAVDVNQVYMNANFYYREG